MTRWLSSADAIKVVTTSRDTYKNYFAEETSENGREIYDLLYDDVVFGWYYCLLDVLPVLTGMNVLFQSRLPLPHLLYPRISAAKGILINMVGVGEVRTRTELIDVLLVDKDTKFGAFANKYIQQEGWTFTDLELKEIKQAWHKLYAHCIADIDRRFPPETMEVFRLFQVLDPSVVHGPMMRNFLGRTDVASAVSELLSIFEIPLHLSLAGKYSTEEIKNSCTAFRTSEVCEDLWKLHTARNARGHNMDYAVVYTYYKALLSMPEISPWAFVCLFLLIFPTGNAVAERGFSAMGAVHSKRRSEMSHEQVWAHMMVQFNGPPLGTYAQTLDAESRMLNWWGHVNHTNYNNH